jgi:hypothetical protein
MERSALGAPAIEAQTRRGADHSRTTDQKSFKKV